MRHLPQTTGLRCGTAPTEGEQMMDDLFTIILAVGVLILAIGLMELGHWIDDRPRRG